jgi:hypothetical protein
MTGFFRSGLNDTDRRLGRITAPMPVDRPEVIAIVRGSRVVDAAAGAFAWAARVSAASLLAQSARAARDAWTTIAWPARRRMAGVVLLVGAVVHIGLTMLNGPPPLWLWLLFPALFAALGALLIAASAGSPQAP